jgi:hypothetical protein
MLPVDSLGDDRLRIVGNSANSSRTLGSAPSTADAARM